MMRGRRERAVGEGAAPDGSLPDGAGQLRRATVAPRHAILLGLVLLVSVLVAAAPLSLILTGSSWLTLPLLGAGPVILAGIVLRLLLRHAVFVPVLQLVLVAVLVLVVEQAQGLVHLGEGPVAVIAAQAEVFHGAVNELASGVAPITVGARALVVVVLLVALVALCLDLMFIDLGWHTATALVLLCFLLVPALQVPSGGPWWTVAGPVLGSMLVLGARMLFSAASTPQPSPSGGPRRGVLGALGATGVLPTGRSLRATGAMLLTVLLIAGLTVPVSTLLPRTAPAQMELSMDLINQWRSREQPQLGAVMVGEDVSVRRSLLQENPTEVLRYTTTADRPSYLRTRTLTRFDGESFHQPLQDVEGQLESFSDARDDEQSPGPEEYDVQLTSLAGNRLPVPLNVRSLSFEEQSLEQDSAIHGVNGEVSLQTPIGLLGGISYRVTAEESPADADELRAIGADQFSRPFDLGYISRGEVPDQAADLAAQVAGDAGADNAFDTALAYQDYFRENFSYSLTVATPPGEDPLASFLADRIGYCEQFASVFALMMTSQGYPTRVAIGFTPGAADGDEHVVSSTNAHAWPEVWLGPEHGWIRFEPTPAAAGNGVAEPLITDESAGSDASPTPTDEPTTTPPPSPGDSPSEQVSATPEESQTPDASDAGGRIQPQEVAQDAATGLISLVVLGLIVAGAATAAVITLRRRRDTARRERWTGMEHQAGPAECRTAAEAEWWRRRAGEVAWKEIQDELDGRALAVRWLGWSGLWGRPALRLALDPALPPARALDDLLDQIAGPAADGDAADADAADGDAAGGSGGAAARTSRRAVTAEHREAAARIGAAVADARYAYPVPTPRSAPAWAVDHQHGAPAPAEAGADGGAAAGAGAARDADVDGAQDLAGTQDAPATQQRPLRPDADLLLDLIRHAR